MCMIKLLPDHKYLAMDADGKWWSYGNKPHIFLVDMWGGSFPSFLIGKTDPDFLPWQDSLMHRDDPFLWVIFRSIKCENPITG